MAAALLIVPGDRGGLLWLMLLLVVAPACDSDSAVEPTLPPPAEPTLRLLVPGEAKLVDCTQGEPAASGGHTWCTFYRPAPGGEARTEIWVVDVSQALAGERVPCDGSSSSCLRMTHWVVLHPRFEDSPAWAPPEAHFQGDTLFFRNWENTMDPNFGSISAWRPGWSRARPMSPDKAGFCRGSRSGQYAYCLGDRDDRGTYGLRAGRLIDQDDSLLPLLDRVSYPADAEWWAEFAQADELFVYPSWPEGEGTGTLQVIPAAELGQAPARTMVADVQRWALSGDGQSVFFQRGSSPGPWGERRWRWSPGSLWAADLPSGAEPMEIASDVLYFRPVSRTGVGFLADPRGAQGTLYIQGDWRHPESRFRMASDVAGWGTFAQDRLTAVWQEDDNGSRTLVGDNERGTTCLWPSGRWTNNGTNNFGGFLSRLGALFWSEPDPADERTTVAFLAYPQDCGDARVLGKGLQFLEEVGSHGLVFGSAPAAAAEAWSLFYLPSHDGRPLDLTSKLILSGVEPGTPKVAGARREALVMRRTGNGASAQGLYLFGPLPPIPSVSRDLP
jgi:hypothetical protein